ncbi:MAG TPA: ComEC/Rec2 family competence protein, partial [Alphaproteobacteria bacterium]|nr:ComEC/Rec2 family competence protein [Alphaproteobacteria bacterium]
MNSPNFLVSSFFNDFQRWPLWLPIFLGLGIILYFYLPVEPPFVYVIGGLLFFALSLWRIRLQTFRLILLSFGVISLGFSAALLRTSSLDTEMLQYPLPVLLLEGKVMQVEMKPTKKGAFYQRILMTHLSAETPEKLPQKIRLTLKGKREHLWPGQVIQVQAKLHPIAEPSLPKGFDFRRQAYFNGIGATGFALSVPEVLGSFPTWQDIMEKRREKVTTYFLTHMPSPVGSIAAALITGDKAAIPEDVRQNFVNSGLAHILAISGLHLTIIAGVVFMIIRRGIALIPLLCLAYNSKKIAAVGTIFMTFLYLVLSGFGIPAQRAFIMISVVMGAILIDRTALSMRTVAFAAFIILLTTPEALLGPSFQLSFAAVVALIAGYEAWKNPLAHWVIQGGIFRKLVVYGGGLIFSSLLATIATLPFTIYLFHRFSLHAVEANLVAVPLTSLVIMPIAFLTCLLVPFGLGEGPLRIFEHALHLLTHIATAVSSWSGANIWVAHPPVAAFILVICGGLWLCLWHQPWRKWGILPMSIGFVTAFGGKLPTLLIDGQGKMAALYDGNTLYVSSRRKGKFTAETWKKYLAAESITDLHCEEGVCRAFIQNTPILISYDEEKQPC